MRILQPVVVFFCRHVPEDLAGDFPRLLSESDVLVMEFDIEDERIDEYERDFNRLSEGSLTPESMIKKYSQEDTSLFGLLHRCGKQVILERSPVKGSEVCEYTDLNRRAAIMKQNRDLVGAVDLKLKALKKFAEMNSRRDAALADAVAQLILKNPAKRILIYRGIAHQRRFLVELTSRRVAYRSVLARPEMLDKESQLIERLVNGESISPAEILDVV